MEKGIYSPWIVNEALKQNRLKLRESSGELRYQYENRNAFLLRRRIERFLVPMKTILVNNSLSAPTAPYKLYGPIRGDVATCYQPPTCRGGFLQGTRV